MAHAGWTTQAGVERFTWRERTTPIAVHEQGPRFGGMLAYVMDRERGALLGAHATLYGGAVGYNGSFQFDSTKSASGSTQYFGSSVGAELRWRWPLPLEA